MVSEAAPLPAAQLERTTLAIELLHNRFRVLESRLAFLDEGVSGLASLVVDWEARLTDLSSRCSALQSDLASLCSQVSLFHSRQQAFEQSFSRRVEQEIVEALSALHRRIDILCYQRADLWAQFCHLDRMASDPPEHFSFVDLEPIEEPVPVVVKRFRKMLPLAAAASQESGLASAPSASAQESPASLRSAPASNDVARELPFADLRPEASHSVPLPGPLDVIARLPEGSRSSFERPVLRDASGALPRPVLSALKEPSSTSSSAPLPRPSFAPAASYAIRSFAVAGGKSTFAAAASAPALPEPSFRTSSGALEKEWLQARDLPVASQDGGGIHSKPDWRLRDHVAAASDSPFLSDKEVLSFRGIANRWFSAQGCRDDINWDKPSGQPYCLHALHSLSQVVKDADKHLFLALLEGVPTGYDGDIPKSNVFTQHDSPPSDGDLLLCFGNWTGAEADPTLLCELLQKEVDAGWLETIPLHEAQARWGSRLAVGHLNIVIAPGKKPRLVVIVDSSVCGTNSCCQVLESYALPGLQHVRFSFPFRMHNGALAGFSLDIEAAHKTVRVRERDRGLLGVQHPLPDGTLRYLFYRVCPFGAVFSAHWFQRVSAFLIRMLYPFLYVRHSLFMYSDDLLGVTEQSVLEITFALVLAVCVCFGYPISWKKLQMGPRILWIGWSFDFGAGGVEVPSDKTSKLLAGLRDVLRQDRVDKRELHRVIGLILVDPSAVSFA
ncbi:hypothetical protein AK812_SmicGene27995 [Symbiodinium microadriaticum]|uniref:Reverse transcriptase domain-containing protein n=1 Tax=Symbiodinium microadriaticum TaxID=2951 RepID=A0A1Q9D5N8_SYMMI|nr:hypothetical protein AK812_SmicGene27995 [Symbiodinium microadriaticum]CAE7365890.1 unnamed protein product [Symbiodinium sp. KB8]